MTALAVFLAISILLYLWGQGMIMILPAAAIILLIAHYQEHVLPYIFAFVCFGGLCELLGWLFK